MADTEALARVLARLLHEHDPDRVGLCDDHEASCCPTGDAHNFRDGYQHQAEASLAALLADPGPLLAALPDGAIEAEALRRFYPARHMTGLSDA